jgi:hypothetical protein
MLGKACGRRERFEIYAKFMRKTERKKICTGKKLAEKFETAELASTEAVAWGKSLVKSRETLKPVRQRWR